MGWSGEVGQHRGAHGVKTSDDTGPGEQAARIFCRGDSRGSRKRDRRIHNDFPGGGLRDRGQNLRVRVGRNGDYDDLSRLGGSHVSAPCLCGEADRSRSRFRPRRIPRSEHNIDRGGVEAPGQTESQPSGSADDGDAPRETTGLRAPGTGLRTIGHRAPDRQSPGNTNRLGTSVPRP